MESSSRGGFSLTINSVVMERVIWSISSIVMPVA
jgi:hypothetical protein